MTPELNDGMARLLGFSLFADMLVMIALIVISRSRRP